MGSAIFLSICCSKAAVLAFFFGALPCLCGLHIAQPLDFLSLYTFPIINSNLLIIVGNYLFQRVFNTANRQVRIVAIFIPTFQRSLL